MRPFWIAVALLTRLPAPAIADPTARARGDSVVYYPLVGLVLGVLLGLVDFGLGQTAGGLRAALVLTAWVLLTGGLHLDGLADSADGWLGGHGDWERTLRIMQDPSSGPAGVMVITLVLIVKFAALSAAANHVHYPVLLIAPMLGRAGIVALFLTAPYVRRRGLGSAQARHLPTSAAVFVLVLCAAGVLLAERWRGGLLLAAAVVSIYLLRRLMLARIGGITGDTLGAACEITEAAVLVAWSVAGG